MTKEASRESNLYGRLGASSSKQGVHQALDRPSDSLFFADLSEDVCGDSSYYSILHSDGAGTKSIVAYLAYKETGDPRWFRTLAYDSLVMNLDDLACVGAFESLFLCNTIGRNKALVPDDVIGEVIAGYRELCEKLANHEIHIALSGGETADMGDLIRTIVLDSSLFGRVRKDTAVNTSAIQSGDIIIGLSNTGTASYEAQPNSSMGSNGFTLARHALISEKYAKKYPEILSPELEKEVSYRGIHDLFDTPSPLDIRVVDALLSPTRTYAPILKKLLSQLGSEIHAMIHCTGGGQTKIMNFGSGKKYVKDDFFPCPPVFSLIQQTLSVPWDEMYAVFNMGHRMEIICSESHESAVNDIVKEFGIDSKRVGYIEGNEKTANSLLIKSPNGTFQY